MKRADTQSMALECGWVFLLDFSWFDQIRFPTVVGSLPLLCNITLKARLGTRKIYNHSNSATTSECKIDFAV